VWIGMLVLRVPPRRGNGVGPGGNGAIGPRHPSSSTAFDGRRPSLTDASASRRLRGSGRGDGWGSRCPLHKLPPGPGVRLRCCGQHGHVHYEAQSAILPATARVAQELTAANVVAGWAENLGTVFSAAIAAIFLKIGQIGWLFALSAAFVGVAAIVVVPVRVSGIALADETDDGRGPNVLFEGLVVTARDERARLLTAS
jgi:hypothetical protein